MEKDYIINNETVVMMSVDNCRCKIYELENEFEVNTTIKKIINLSCKYFGSSFEGRLEGSKFYLNYDYKLPIIIDEHRDIIVFPLKSYNSSNNYIIFPNKIKSYKKTNNGILITTINDKKIEIKDSFGIFDNQYLKSQKLLINLYRIKNTQ